MSIREKLGLGPKNDTIKSTLTDDTFDNTPGPSSEVDLHSAASTTQPGAVDEVPTDAVLNEEEAMAAAAERLEALELTAGSWSLIDRSMDSLSKNTGAGLEDPDAVQRAKEQAALVKAADNNLQVCVAALLGSCAPQDAAGTVYGFLYRVLGNAAFFANLDYQQVTSSGFDMYNDEATVNELFARYVSSTYVDEALSHVVDDLVLSTEDNRERDENDKRTQDQGFDTRRDIQLRYIAEKYGQGEDLDLMVIQALEDIRLFFGLTVESMGWDPTRPMPYSNVRNPDGSYTPIEDALQAIEAQEIKRVASQQRRREKRTATMSAATAAAAAILQKSLQRPTVHTKK